MRRFGLFAWFVAGIVVVAIPVSRVTAQEQEGHEVASEHADEGGDAGHGAAGHHDSTDLGHQNAGPKLEDPSLLKSDLALWTLVVFGCLLAVLAKFAWGPIVAGLDRREAAIAAQIDDAKKSAEQAAIQLQQYQAQLAAAGDEARQILAEGRRDAEVAAERVRSEAQQAAERERQRAVADIANAKNAALQEMTERSVDLATLMAGRMLQRQLNPEDHSQLIREALEQLPSQN